MVDGGHAPTIPSAVALMGFHQANITRHNAEVLRASVAQRSAGPAAAPPPSGVPVSAGVSDATRQPSSANQVQVRCPATLFGLAAIPAATAAADAGSHSSAAMHAGPGREFQWPGICRAKERTGGVCESYDGKCTHLLAAKTA